MLYQQQLPEKQCFMPAPQPLSLLVTADDAGTNHSYRLSTAHQTNHSGHLIHTALLRANLRMSPIQQLFLELTSESLPWSHDLFTAPSSNKYLQTNSSFTQQLLYLQITNSSRSCTFKQPERVDRLQLKPAVSHAQPSNSTNCRLAPTCKWMILGCVKVNYQKLASSQKKDELAKFSILSGRLVVTRYAGSSTPDLKRQLSKTCQGHQT